jgi:putative tricarboxylic transport membrane protein
MTLRNSKDIVAGSLLVVIGLAVAIRSLYFYKLGTVSHMGPGMFPAVLGFVLAGIGALIFVPAFFGSDPLPRPDYRQIASVIAGVLLFAASIDSLGMVPAIFLVTIAAVMADNKLTVFQTILLGAGLSLLSVLIFRIVLAVPLDIVKWPL